MTTAPLNHTLRLAGRIFAPAVFGIGLIIILLEWTTNSGSTITVSAGSALIAIASLAGLLGAYLALCQILLQSRLPLLEAPFGRAGLVRVHRVNGYAVLLILYLHLSLVTLGYAVNNQVSIIKQYLTFLTSFPYVWWGSIALFFLTGIAAISVTIVRRKLKYETWFYVHLVTYAAILLAFSHQLAVGVDFSTANAAWFRHFWWGLYIFTFGSVVVFRFGRPLIRLMIFQTEVERVVPEAAGITSIYIKGTRLGHLKYVPGQFMIWRFLDGKRFGETHPFTISQAPNGTSLRLTFKAVGDFTRELANVRPGTPVMLDGPYGTFTLQDEMATKLLFIAGGIGLTPLRAMIEAMPKTTSAVLIYAVRRVDDIALTTELEALAISHKLKIIYLISDEKEAGFEHGTLSAETLERLVPDLIQRQVYLCGPVAMMAAATELLVEAGLDETAIHSEKFAF